MQRNIFEVDREGEGWVLRQKGIDGSTSFPTREAAVAAGRAKSKANSPSVLRIRKVRNGE